MMFVNDKISKIFTGDDSGMMTPEWLVTGLHCACLSVCESLSYRDDEVMDILNSAPLVTSESTPAISLSANALHLAGTKIE
jgi:hypothetical protein